MKNEFIYCYACSKQIEGNIIKDYSLKKSFCSIDCHKKFRKNTMYTELLEKNTDNESNEIEKLFNLVSLLRTELSFQEEFVSEKFTNNNEIILNLKNKILSLTQDVEYNYISSEEIMNKKFEKLNDKLISMSNDILINSTKCYEQQQEILSLKSDIKLMNQILKDWMKKFFNYSGLSKDEPQ